MYVGGISPVEHVTALVDWALLHCYSDTILCHAFPLTLSKEARLWFGTLEHGLISLFSQLSRRFVL